MNISKRMTDKKWLVVIAIILTGIFALLLLEATQKSPEEKVGESISSLLDSASDRVHD